MDYHPKEILVTAIYLACKCEEFNVSIEQFVANIKGNKDRAMDIVLNNELLLMRELDYHLTVHNAYRPVEGILIDIKTRCKSLNQSAEVFRGEIDSFLDKVLYTNAYFIYSPSQIALSSVIHAAGRNGENVDSYVTDILVGTNIEDVKLKKIIDAVRNIRVLVKNVAKQAEAAKVCQGSDKKCISKHLRAISGVFNFRLSNLSSINWSDVVIRITIRTLKRTSGSFRRSWTRRTRPRRTSKAATTRT